MPLRPPIYVSSLDGWARLKAVRDASLPLPDDYGIQQEWVTSLYVPTQRDEAFSGAVHQTMRRNGGSQRHWLGVDSRANFGKSDMFVHWALSHTQFDNDQPMRGANGYAQLPVLYVAAGPTHEGAGLTRMMCRFAGIVPERTEEGMRNQLARVLPKLGTVCVGIDDAQFLKRVDAKSTRLADSARALLRLPVTFVFLGAGLENSALLRYELGEGYQSAEQMRTRCSMMMLQRLVLPTDSAQLDTMIRRFAGRVGEAIPSMTFPGLRSGAVRKELLKHCDGLHGKVFEVLKNATVASLETNRVVTADLIAAEWPEVSGQPNEIDLRSTPPPAEQAASRAAG